jgi:hypothetical protein
VRLGGTVYDPRMAFGPWQRGPPEGGPPESDDELTRAPDEQTQPGVPLGEDEEVPTDEHAALGDADDRTDEHAALKG